MLELAGDAQNLLCGGVARAVKRDYPNEGSGWVEGVYGFRAMVEDEVRALEDGSPLSMTGRVFAEESQPLDGDANTIARATYRCGTFVIADLPACDWRVHATFGGVRREERVELVVNDLPRIRMTLRPDTSKTVEFVVPLDRRRLELCVVPVEMPGDSSEVLRAELQELSVERVSRQRAARPRIFVAADSTSQTYFDYERPQSGWGEWLYWFLYSDHAAKVDHDITSDAKQSRVFIGNGPTIFNRGLGGRSLKSYRDEGRLDSLLSQVCPGDICLIQFGCNETSTNRPMRYIPLDEYRSWVEDYVDSVCDRDAVPCLITESPLYVEAGRTRPHGVFDDYAQVAIEVARERGVAMIDVRALMDQYLLAMPGQARDAIYMRLEPMQYACHPTGLKDPIHLTTFGAKTVAGMVARGLAALFNGIQVYDEPVVERLDAPAQFCALIDRIVSGAAVALSWQADPRAQYYVIEKRNAQTKRVYARYVSLKPEFLDRMLPGQNRDIEYALTAWADTVSSAEALATVTLPSSDSPCIDMD